MEKAAIKWRVRDVMVVGIIITAVLLALNFVLYILGTYILGARDFFINIDKSVLTLGLFFVQELIFILPLYFLVIKKYRLGPDALGFRTIGTRQAIKWILAAYGLVILFNIFFAFISRGFDVEIPGFGRQVSHIPLFGKSAFDITIAVIVLVIIAPFIEELFFRGFVLQTFLSRYRPAAANFITAAIFTVIHFEFGSAAIILFLAFVLNWIFIRTRSLWPCVGFHMLNNALAFTIELLEWNGYLQL